MIAEGIQKILDIAASQVLEIGGRHYTSREVKAVKEPMPETLHVATLTAIAEYLTENPDGLPLSGATATAGSPPVDGTLVHVVGPKTVRVHSTLGQTFMQRRAYVEAQEGREGFVYGQFMGVETFIIQLLSKFESTEDREKLLKLTGNLTDGRIHIYEDDGYTQQVTAKTGIARVQSVDASPFVTLTPYRTFEEVEQPASKFLFRMRSSDEDSPPQCALYEADGGAWEHDAIAAIYDWLKGKIPAGVTILG